MIWLVLIVIVFAIIMVVLHCLLLEYLTKDLNEKEKEEFYKIYEQGGESYSIFETGNRDNWFNPF